MLDRIADERELHGAAPRSIKRSKNRKTRVIGKVLQLDRLGENRVEPAEFAAQHVGEKLVADDGDLAPAQLQAPLRAQEAERQRLERIRDAGDVELRGEPR